MMPLRVNPAREKRRCAGPLEALALVNSFCGEALELKLPQQSQTDPLAMMLSCDADQGNEPVAKKAVLQHGKAKRLATGHGKKTGVLLSHAAQLEFSALMDLGVRIAFAELRQISFDSSTKRQLCGGG
jgi:hypothetical protein